MIARIDADALAAHFGTAIDEDDPAGRTSREEMGKMRDALRDALFRKARALVWASSDEPDDDERRAAAESAWDDLAKWDDVEDDTYFDLRVDRERRAGHLGRALEIVNEKIEDEESPEVSWFELRDELIGELGWEFLVDMGRRDRMVRFPAAKLVF